jgi:nitrite reductase/ring-hydroxylating ferredoxin subunit
MICSNLVQIIHEFKHLFKVPFSVKIFANLGTCIHAGWLLGNILESHTNVTCPNHLGFRWPSLSGASVVSLD